MVTINQQMIKSAGMIQAQLGLWQEHRWREVQRLIHVICTNLDLLQTGRRYLEQCAHRRWYGAALRLTGRLESKLRDLPYTVEQALHLISSAKEPLPSLRQLYEELSQLQSEFGQVMYDLQERIISVSTDPIELEGVFLGDFEIGLEIDQLAQLQRGSAFRISALDPHPAATNESVTHPHVSEECLCAGDAHTAIIQALATGRLCDAFLLVRSVLETYNPLSPYVSLDQWDGVACYDCGYIIHEEDTYYCECCDHHFCSECFSYCRGCDASYCRGCLTSCPVCGELFCEACMSSCSECDETMCILCLEDGVCSSCKEELEADDEKESINSESNVA